MLRFFEEKDGSLIFRENGETVMVTPWGENSFRVRAAFLGEIEEGSIALMEPQRSDADFQIDVYELDASITNGKISASFTVNTWGNALQITFRNQKGEVLLKEIPNGGALQKKARHFKPLLGGGYRLKASFVSDPQEKIYGMGQYQQETFNLKGCNLELAHRNSQASIPFYISSLGYGFLWHNAAVGEVHFGSNTTKWVAEETKQQGLLVKSNSGIDVQMIFHGNNVFMDVTNPRTREYVWDKCRKNYADIGIRTFWLDEAEPEFSTYDHADYRLHVGPVAQVGNIYPREYARLFYEGQRASGQNDIVNLIRCAWVGSQRYGALVWSGDIMSGYEDFRKQICAGIHMGVCGIPWWTTDIGGFHGGNIHEEGFKELLIRWFQFGTFCPVMRIHGCRLPGEEIINNAGEVREWTGAENEVWSYGKENYEIMVKFIHIREMMRDYTRSIMKEAHETGTPVMRALFYEFPEDEVCWEIKDAYMFGSDILVAPICHEKARKRKVYLPKGASFVHAGSGRQYEGGEWYEIEADICTLPVFLREGRQEYLIGKI